MTLPRLSIAAVALCALVAGGCSTVSPETGPTLGVRNDSDAPLRATFWVGDRTAQRPGLPADMKAQETLEIPPFGTRQFRLHAFSGYDSPTTSFVRLQVEPIGPSFQYQQQHWFELNPPSPYTVRVHGRKPDLAFERVGGGTMVMIPRELWFRNAPATAGAMRLNTPTAHGAAIRQPLNTRQPLASTPATATNSTTSRTTRGQAPASTQVTGVNER